MPYKVIGNHKITIPGVSYGPGDTIPELDPDLAEFLIKTGHIEPTVATPATKTRRKK